MRLRALAHAWGSRTHSLGAVGHLNPASGYGEWPEAIELIAELRNGPGQVARDAFPAPLTQLVPA